MLGAPLVFFFFVFHWRDSVGVPHIPFADLVAVVAVADITAAIDLDLARNLLDASGYVHSDISRRWPFLFLSVVGYFACKFLIVVCEKQMAPIMIHHMDVGWRRLEGSQRMGGWRAIRRNRNWITYNRYWSVCIAVVATYLAIHGAVLGMRIDPQLVPGVLSTAGPFLSIVFVGLISFAVAALMNFALTMINYYRFDGDH